MPFRWAALRGRYYVHLVQMHGPFPNLVRVGVPLFAGLSSMTWTIGFLMGTRNLADWWQVLIGLERTSQQQKRPVL